MADYSLAQRGSTSITSADTSPKDVTLPSPVKLGSSLFNATVRDRRRNELVQAGVETVSSGGTSPVNVTITAVDVAASTVQISVRENRDGVAHGVTARLTSSTNLRIEFYGTVDAAENIEVAWQVIESKPQRGATARLFDENTVRIAWDGTLATGETIDVNWEVWDFNDVGNDLLEILFRELRILAYLGENLVTDLLTYDDAGNIVTCRLRIFDTKAHAETCIFDLPIGSGLEDGELARAQIVQEIDKPTNNRTALIRTLEEVADTPGVS